MYYKEFKGNKISTLGLGSLRLRPYKPSLPRKAAGSRLWAAICNCE